MSPTLKRALLWTIVFSWAVQCPAAAIDVVDVKPERSPIDVVGCTPVPSGPGLAGLVSTTIRVSYIARSTKAIRYVQFEINSGGVLRHAGDSGLRRKGDAVEHELVIDDGAVGSRVPAVCTLSYAVFNDGKTYGHRFTAPVPPVEQPAAAQVTPQFKPQAVARATPVPPPVAIEACDGRFDDPSNNDYDVTVGITFEVTGDKIADVVKFDLQLVDPFGKVLQHETGTMYGTFTPGVTIRPRKAALVDKFLTQPQFPNSPAWSISNFSGHDVNRIMCTPSAVHFTDGTVWNR